MGAHWATGTGHNWSVWVQKVFRIKRILGKWNRTHQESISPPGQKSTEYDVTILELWSLWKDCFFQGKNGKVNLGQFELLAQETYPSPISSHTADSCACAPGAAYTQLATAGVGKKDPVLPVSGIWTLIAASDHRSANKWTAEFCVLLKLNWCKF